MNVWPLFIAAGRLGSLWINGYYKRKIFLTVVTVSFVLYHFEVEKQKTKNIGDGNRENY